VVLIHEYRVAKSFVGMMFFRVVLACFYAVARAFWGEVVAMWLVGCFEWLLCH